LTQQQIAERLWISPNTIKSHMNNIFARLRVNTMHGAVGAALREGIIE